VTSATLTNCLPPKCWENITLSLLYLLAGGAIYVLWRPESIFINVMLQYLVGPLGYSRLIGTFTSVAVAPFFVYSLPAALWVAAFGHALLCVVPRNNSREQVTWLLVPPAIGIASELAQSASMLPGTYDADDVMAYLSAGMYLQLIRYL